VALGLYLFIAFYAVDLGMRVAGPVRTDADAHPFQRNELCAGHQSACFNHAGRNFSAFVSKHGYSSMFFLFASFTLVYFLVAALFLPETKGKTLEEIEAHFEGKPRVERGEQGRFIEAVGMRCRRGSRWA